MHASSPRTRPRSRRTRQWRVHCKRHGQKKELNRLPGHRVRQRQMPMGCRPARTMRPRWRLPARRPRTRRRPPIHRPRIPKAHQTPTVRQPIPPKRHAARSTSASWTRASPRWTSHRTQPSSSRRASTRRTGRAIPCCMSRMPSLRTVLLVRVASVRALRSCASSPISCALCCTMNPRSWSLPST